VALWLAAYLESVPDVLDTIYGAKTNPGALGNLLSLLVSYVRLPGSLVASWIGAGGSHPSYLAWIVATLINAFLYMLLMFLVSTRRATGSLRGLLWGCVFFLSINIGSTTYLCLNTKRIACFDCDPNVAFVIAASALPLILGALACWWFCSGIRTEDERPAPEIKPERANEG
jgi:hypothetical protein